MHRYERAEEARQKKEEKRGVDLHMPDIMLAEDYLQYTINQGYRGLVDYGR